LRLDGKELVRTPCELRYGFHRQVIERGLPATTHLMLGVVKHGRAVVVLHEEWGLAHGAPDWPEALPTLQGDEATLHVKVLGLGKFCPIVVATLGGPRQGSMGSPPGNA
jgi:hypothetical protein